MIQWVTGVTSLVTTISSWQMVWSLGQAKYAGGGNYFVSSFSSCMLRSLYLRHNNITSPRINPSCNRSIRTQNNSASLTFMMASKWVVVQYLLNSLRSSINNPNIYSQLCSRLDKFVNQFHLESCHYQKWLNSSDHSYSSLHLLHLLHMLLICQTPQTIEILIQTCL